MKKRGGQFTAFFLAALLSSGLSFSLSSCSSARMKDREADSLFASGRYAEAATHLKHGLEKEGENGRDKLLYLLDLGLALHAAGDYAESNKVLLEADRFAEIKDYTSIATEAATSIVSENMKDYRAEDFENVLINVYLAMNFSALGLWEDALVEARRVNRKLYLMVSEGKRKYKQNAFAHYLSGVLHELIHEYDNAYIDYKKVYELMPSYPGLRVDLWRLASELKIREDKERWVKELDLKEADFNAAKGFLKKSGKGELIVLYQNGISPVKIPDPNWRVIPKFYPRANPVTHAEVRVQGEKVADTALLHDIESTAIENLDEKYGALIAKKIAGVVVKEGVAIAVERQTENPLLGLATRLALYAADQADLRSWNLLPKDLQVLRVPLDPGDYEVEVVPVGGSENSKTRKTVKIEAGKKFFFISRFTPDF